MANTYSVSLSMTGANQSFSLCELDTINYSVAGGNVLSAGIFVIGSSGCSVTVSSNGVGSGTETGTISGFTGSSYSVTWRQLRDPEFGGGYDEVTLSGNVTATQSPAFPSASNYNISTYATSQTVPIFGGSPSTDAYSLCLTPGLTTNVQVVNDRIAAITLNGAQSFTVSGSNLPNPGQTKYYYIYSYRYDDYCGEQQYYYSSSFYIFRPFIPPSTSATCSNTTIAYNYSGSLTLAIINGSFSANDAYRLCRTGGTKTFSQIVADQVAYSGLGGSSFTIAEAELPGLGATEDYTVYAYLAPAAGGEGVYKEAGTFYVNRLTEVVTPPTDITFAFAATESSTTTATVGASGGSGGTLQVSSNNSTWYNAPATFSVTRGSNPTFYARRLGATTASSSYSESVNVPYLPTNLSSVSVSNYFAVAPTQTSQSVPYSGGVSGHDYQLRFYSPVAAVDTVLNSTSGTFTAAGIQHPVEGQTIWYTVAARRTVAAGGSSTSYGDTGTSLYISRRFATPNGPIASNGGEFSSTVSINLYLQNNSSVITNPTNAIIRQFVNGVVANTQTLTWTGNGTYSTAFTQPRNTGGNTYQYNVFLLYKPPGNTGISEIIQIGLDRWAYTYSNTGPAYDAGFIPPDRFITFPTSLSIEPSDTSLSIPLTGASSGTTYRIYDGGTLLQSISGSTGAFSLTNAQLPTSGSKTYTIYCLLSTANGGSGVQTLADGNISPPNVVVTRAAATSITNFNPALSVYTEGSGTQTVTFNFSISNPNQSTYYWQIIRLSGIEEGEFSATTGSVLASSPSFSTTITNNTTDETGSQGETFYARLYTDSGRTQQIGPNSGQFTLYDNDVAFAIGTISPNPVPFVVSGPVTVQVTNNGQSGLQPNSRIWNITKGVVAYAIADLPNPGLTETYTLNLSNNDALPNPGTSNTYRLEVWNGQQLLSGLEFTITREAEDTTPNQFTFTDVTGVALGSTQTSNTVTIAGINTSVSVSITGGTYSKNGGVYTSSAGTAVSGDTFSVRHTASSSYSTAVNTTLTVGQTSDTFTSTTEAAIATYFVEIFAESEPGFTFVNWNWIVGDGGLSQASPKEVNAGELIAFRLAAGSLTPVTLSGFASTHWTNTTNLSLTTSYQIKEVKSGISLTVADGITATYSTASVTRWFIGSSLKPDKTVTLANNAIEISAGATSHTIVIQETAPNTNSAITEYRSFEGTTGHESRVGPGSLTVTDVPPNPGFAKYYSLQARITEANGGNNIWESVPNSSYSVIESSAQNTNDPTIDTYGIALYDHNGTAVTSFTSGHTVLRRIFTTTVTLSSSTTTSVATGLTGLSTSNCIISTTGENIGASAQTSISVPATFSGGNTVILGRYTSAITVRLSILQYAGDTIISGTLPSYGIQIRNGNNSLVIDEASLVYGVSAILNCGGRFVYQGQFANFIYIDLPGTYANMPVVGISCTNSQLLVPPHVYNVGGGAYRTIVTLPKSAQTSTYNIAVLVPSDAVTPQYYGGSASDYGVSISDSSGTKWRSDWRQAIVNNIVDINRFSDGLNQNGAYDVDSGADGVSAPEAAPFGQSEFVLALQGTGQIVSVSSLNEMDPVNTYLIGTACSGYVEYYAGDLVIDGVLVQEDTGGSRHIPAAKITSFNTIDITMWNYDGGFPAPNSSLRCKRNPQSKHPQGNFMLARIV